MIKVFLSWSNELTGLVAERFEERLRIVFGEKVDPFVSRNMRPGTQPLETILAELNDARYLLAFLTRDELSPPWVVFEAGAASKQADKYSVIPITIGFKPGQTEPPLQIMRQGVALDHEDGIRRVFTTICETVSGDSDKLELGFRRWFDNLLGEVNERLRKSLVAQPETWKVVKRARLAEVTADSPFEAKDALRTAHSHVVFTGQNLYGLVGRDRPVEQSWFCKESIKFLKAGDRYLDFLVMDHTKPDLVSAWSRSVGEPEFGQQLCDCVSALVELKRIAQAQNVGDRVKIRLADYIPLSMTFIDPNDQSRGVLFLRAFTRGDAPRNRPIVLITRKEHTSAFSFYWDRHDTDFNCNRTTREP